jgi:hypothetical protein
MTEHEKDFRKVFSDFSNDFKSTFPDKWDTTYYPGVEILLDENVSHVDCFENEEVIKVIEKCKKTYSPEFFAILYQQTELFEKHIEFIPGIDFNNILSEDISERTKEIIWKYLQLILFSVMKFVDDTDNVFGDTSRLFEAVDKDEFRDKLEETMRDFERVFKDISGETDVSASSLNPDELHDHMNGLLGGKIGSLAKEIAEETAKDMNIDLENVNSSDEVFKRLLKDPTNLMSLVKSVGEKVDAKMKSGEIKQSELIEEAGEMLTKMKNIPGMKQMMSKLGGQNMNGANIGAMQNMLNTRMRESKTRERLQRKLKERQSKQEKVFTVGEKPERSSKSDEALIKELEGDASKKKRKKKRKNKHKGNKK